MTDYSKLSYFEINKRVLKLKSGFNPLSYAHDSDKRSAGYLDINGIYHWFDFCNSWADAGPIAERNRISVRNRHEEDWLAVNEWGASHSDIDKNPCRAICIVFLMMNEG